MNRKFLTKRSTLLRNIAALFVGGALLTPSAQAQTTYYWDSDGTTAGFGATTGTWGTNTFWSTVAAGTGATANTTITSLDTVNFGTTLNYNNAAIGIVAGGVNVGSIVYGSGQTTGITLGTAGNAINITSGITMNSGAAAQTISSPVALAANNIWTNNSATNALTLSGAVTGSFGLTKAGAGTIILTNNSAPTHTTTTINAGTLAFRPVAASVPASYGFGSGLITINGGTFAFNGNLAGTFTLTNNFSIGSSGGTLDFSRSALNPNHDFTGTFDLSGNLTLSSSSGGGGTFQGQISGITTLNGGNRTITVANGSNSPTIILGSITQDASPRLLTIDSTSANSQVLQISGNNTGLTGGIQINRTAGSQRVRFDLATSLGGGSAGSVAWSDISTVVGLNFAAVTADLQKLNPGASAVVGVDGNYNLDLGATSPYSWTNKDTVRVGAIGNTTYTGTITPGSSGYRFATSAGSTLTLSGANKLTGTNDVNIATANGTTGVIAVNNNNDLVGTITVQSNAILRVSAAATTPFGAAANQINLTATTAQLNLTGGNITIPNQITGSGSLSVSSANTFTLTNANTYSGGTTISAGTLALSGGNDRLSSTGTVNVTGTSALDIGSTNQTLAAFTVANLANTSTTINGSGALTINGASNFEFGSGGAVPNSTTLTYSLNMSALSNFTYNAAANTFRVGLKSGATNGSGTSVANSTVLLGNTNSITAATLAVGDVTASNNGGTQVLRLGTNNTLNVGAVNIGFSGRSNATLNFNTGLTNPSVTLRGTAGGSTPVATFNVGAVAQFTGAAVTTFTDTVDFSSGTVNAIVTSSTIGQADAGGSATRTGTVNASFTMGAGSFTVETLTIGRLAGTSAGSLGAAYTANGTFTLNNAAGTLNATTINLAENTIQSTGAFNRTVTGTLALTDGTIKATTIQLGTQGGINGGATLTVTPQINWTTGTIQNTDSADLTITGVPITLLTSATHTFNASGTQSIIQAASSPISGATFGITKTGSGTLLLNATNTYSGGTTISNGTVTLGHATDTLANTGAVNVNGGTLALGTNTDTVGAVTLTNGSITGTGAGTLTGSSYNVQNGSVSAILGGTAIVLTKTTGGTVTLSGPNTYSGATDVQAGTLALTGSGTLGAGNVIVNGILDIAGITPASYTLGTAQVLSGDGTINATGKILNINGTLAPGNSPGSLDVTGDVVLAGTTISNFEIGPSSNDLLAVTGSLTYAGALNINTTQTTGSFDLFDFGSLGVGDFSSITLSNAFTGSLTNGGGGIWTGSDGLVNATFTDSTGVLSFTAIPEPSTLVLGGLALLGLAGTGLRRRRMAKQG